MDAPKPVSGNPGAGNPSSGRTTVGGRYTLLSPVGSGGMGTVWRAYDELLRREIAVKEVLLPPGLPRSEREMLCERTLREARASAALNHPSVIRVYDVVNDGDRPWIVMELLDAKSIADILRDDGPLPVPKVAEVGLAVLGALEAAHRVGVLHRDVKPGNVLLGTDGRVTLTDFGVARSPNESPLTSTGLLLGSPQYIAPERARGRPFGPPSDLFSLGATLYTAIEGRPPFDRGDPLPTMTAVVCEPPDAMTLAGPLAPVLFGLMEKDPEQRWDPDRTRAALRTVASGGRVTAMGGTAPKQGGPRQAGPVDRLSPLRRRRHGEEVSAPDRMAGAMQQRSDQPARSPATSYAGSPSTPGSAATSYPGSPATSFPSTPPPSYPGSPATGSPVSGPPATSYPGSPAAPPAGGTQPAGAPVTSSPPDAYPGSPAAYAGSPVTPLAGAAEPAYTDDEAPTDPGDAGGSDAPPTTPRVGGGTALMGNPFDPESAPAAEPGPGWLGPDGTASTEPIPTTGLRDPNAGAYRVPPAQVGYEAGPGSFAPPGAPEPTPGSTRPFGMPVATAPPRRAAYLGQPPPEPPPPPMTEVPPTSASGARRSRLWIWFAAAAALLVLVIGVGTYALSAALLGGDQPKPARSSVANDGVDMQQFNDPRGFSVNVPNGWTKAEGGSYVDFNEPNTGRKVRLLVENSPTDQRKHFKAAEGYQRKQQRDGKISDFNTVRLTRTSARLDGRETWEWEWTYTKAGVPRRVVWRGTVRDGKSYMIYVSAPDRDFAADRTLLDEMTRSFRFAD